MALAVCRRPLTAEARISSQASPCRVNGGQSGTETRFSLNVLVLSRQYYSANSPYSFVDISTILYNLSN
jgi:hypothetical protein